jgi:hypothetical protein
MSNPLGRPRKREYTAEELEANRKARIEFELSIETMAGNGLTAEQIMLLTKLKPHRLYRQYREALLRGQAKAVNEVSGMARLLASGGPERDWRRADAGMIKFWLERQGGANWRAPRDGDEGPDLASLTTEQLIALERALRPLAKAPMIDVTPSDRRDREVKDGEDLVAEGEGEEAAGAGEVGTVVEGDGRAE